MSIRGPLIDVNIHNIFNINIFHFLTLIFLIFLPHLENLNSSLKIPLHYWVFLTKNLKWGRVYFNPPSQNPIDLTIKIYRKSCYQWDQHETPKNEMLKILKNINGKMSKMILYLIAKANYKKWWNVKGPQAGPAGFGMVRRWARLG